MLSVRPSLLLSALLVTSAAAPSVRADSGDRSAAQRFAVVVGNNRSAEPGVEPLRFADDDAVLFARVLAPFVQQVELLTLLDDASQRRYPGVADTATPPTVAALRQALARSFARIEQARAAGAPRTELYFVFVGHGGVDREGKGYLHLQDGRLSRADLFHQVVAASPADYTHLVLDACNAFSVVAGRGQDDDDQRALDRAVQSFLAGHDLEDYPSVGVLAATTDNRETHEWSRIQAGIFSHQVRSALSGAADINLDGAVEYSEVAAFVDAANAGLAGSGKRLSAFAWPPARNRRAPLVELAHGQGLRQVVVDAALEGRLFVERASEERWVELNASDRGQVVLYLPVDTDFFLRDGLRETPVPAGAESFWISKPPEQSYTVSSRGVVDQIFERRLFAVPFDLSYYRGFVSGQPQLVAVEQAAGVELEPPREPWLHLSAGYALGLAPPVAALEHGAFVRGEVELGRGFGAGLELQGAHAWLDNGNELSRADLLPYVRYRSELTGWLGVEGALGVGYGAMGLSGDHGGWDLAVGAARARLGADLNVWGPLWLQAGGAWAAYLVTVDGEETVVTAPQLMLGLSVVP